MEQRTKDLTHDAKSIGREVKEAVSETVEDWADRSKAAMETARFAYKSAQSKALQGAKATDQAIRANPYASVGIAFGVGLLVGFLIKRK